MEHVTLGAAKAEARARLGQADYAGALRAYDRLLAAAPLDGVVRLRVAELLARMGMTDEAAEVYETLAAHDAAAGHPLPAVVACHALAALGRATDERLRALAGEYAAGSPRLARFTSRLTPLAPDTRVELPLPDPSEPLDVIAERARRRAVDLSTYTPVSEQVHALPLLSELDADALHDVFRSLKPQRVVDGALVTRQGDPGTALYLVATGQVRVFAVTPEGGETELARLHENSLFGEMALLTDQPRGASVAADEEADVLEIGREALEVISAARPIVRSILDRFARERLVKNLLAHSPLFAPFTKPQQAELLRRFEGIDVEPGTEVIRQGEPGLGLYVVLSGELEAIASVETETTVALGRLVTGDIFGEMAVLANQPTSASVRAVTKSSVLFLARTYVERLAAAIPEVRGYFESVAERRRRDNTLRLGVTTEMRSGADDDDALPLV